MNHYLIAIQYDGSAHRGWQRLANEPDTVQGILENALSAYFKESIRITGSGRTDAGVHALRQYADFFCRASLNIQQNIYILHNAFRQTGRFFQKLRILPC